jgi:probable LLM family oxidoreductase
MEVGIDSFAATYDEVGLAESPAKRMKDLIEQIVQAEAAGLDSFGVGEHHRREYLDSAAPVILGGAATVTKKIRLTSAVSVLSAIDPVRLFQQFATLDLLSNGRVEIVVGRGSSVDAFPLFGLDLKDYDSLFAEHLELLLKLRTEEQVTWSGESRPTLSGQGVYPRPLQDPLPVWLGVGGTPGSFARAGTLGLPLMVAIIGGETRRFRPLIDLYYEAGEQAGYPREALKVGMHSLGFVASSKEHAADAFFPGYAKAFASVAKERGWSIPTRAQFDAQLGAEGALLVGSPAEVADKVLHHSEALGGISRVTFQMNASSVPQEQMLQAIELLGSEVAPALHGEGV